MAQQWYRDKVVIIGFAAGSAVLAGLALAYSSKRDTATEDTLKEEPDAKVHACTCLI